MAAPPFPSVPWQPAQFCLYSVSKSEMSAGLIWISSGRGRPGELAQPDKLKTITPALTTMSDRRFIAARPSRQTNRALQNRRATQMASPDERFANHGDVAA